MSAPTTLHQVKDRMSAAGIECFAPLYPDGKIRRFKVGDYGRKPNGWYWLVERDGKFYGAAGDWKTQVRVTFGGHNDRVYRDITLARLTVDAVTAEQAAVRARDEWTSCLPTGESPYLERKGVAPFGVRFKFGSVIVPMVKNDLIVGLQTIDRDGGKLFTRGCAKRGSSHLIKGGYTTVLVEGYATGASIHIATGMSVLVCFDAGNLVEVAIDLALAGADPVKYIVAGDNDIGTRCRKHKTSGWWDGKGQRPAGCLCNPGVPAANAAAKALRCKVLIPRPESETSVDWNDILLDEGANALGEQIASGL